MINDDNENASSQTHRQQIHRKADAAIAATNILGQFEEVMIQDAVQQSYQEERQKVTKVQNGQNNKMAKTTTALLTDMGDDVVKLYADEEDD